MPVVPKSPLKKELIPISIIEPLKNPVNLALVAIVVLMALIVLVRGDVPPVFAFVGGLLFGLWINLEKRPPEEKKMRYEKEVKVEKPEEEHGKK